MYDFVEHFLFDFAPCFCFEFDEDLNVLIISVLISFDIVFFESKLN